MTPLAGHQQTTWHTCKNFSNAANVGGTPDGSASNTAASVMRQSRHMQRTPLSPQARPFNSVADANRRAWVSIFDSLVDEQSTVRNSSDSVMLGRAPNYRVHSNDCGEEKSEEFFMQESSGNADNRVYSRSESLRSDTSSPGRQTESGVWNVPSRTSSTSSEDLHRVASSLFRVPVKHTFIHFDYGSCVGEDDTFSFDSKRLQCSASAPGLLMRRPYFALKPTPLSEEEERLKMSEMVKRHASGSCSPCAYFHKKEDSCRLGMQCMYCHICPPDAMHKFRKQKAKQLRRSLAARSRQAKLHAVNAAENRRQHRGRGNR
mmetsp:Transcript_44088/g.81029  ORF Transcript_44088/g.81029 Transcript_44088/m.81029 type:complete len:318 (+) Transcript_44088:85-1038(+)